MSFWFPDNVQRRDRASQLSNDTTLLQNGVAEAETDIKGADDRMLPLINSILAGHGMATFTELKAKLDAAFTPEQKAMYDALIARAQKTSDGLDNSMMGISAIMFTCGIVGKFIDIGNFLRAGHVVLTFQQYGRAFVTLITEGLSAGRAAFKAAAASADAAVDALQDASKLAKYASKAAEVLKIVAIVGVIADAFILAFAAYEESKQRDELRAAINDLFVKRLIAKFYSRMTDSIKTWKGMTFSMLSLITGPGGTVDPVMQPAITLLGASFATQVQTDWNGVTTESCYVLLATLDSSRSSWTNEDPSKATAIAAADTSTATV